MFEGADFYGVTLGWFQGADRPPSLFKGQAGATPFLRLR